MMKPCKPTNIPVHFFLLISVSISLVISILFAFQIDQILIHQKVELLEGESSSVVCACVAGCLLYNLNAVGALKQSLSVSFYVLSVF